MSTFKGLLLAAAFTAGVPAMALAQDQGDHHHGDHGNGGNGGGERPARGDHNDAARPNAQQAPQPQAQPQRQAPPPQAQPQRQAPPPQAPQAQGQRPQDFRGDRGNHGADQRPDQNNGNRWGPGAPGGQGGYRPDPNQGNRWGPGAPGGQGGYRPDPNRDPNRGGQFAPGNPGWRGDQRPDQFRPGGPSGPGGLGGGPRYRPDFRSPSGQGFAHDWRNDRRFDWRGYRDQHREVFRGPRYIAPQGWGYGYRRFDVGIRIPPFFFGQQYWIADPWYYRLPPIDGPYRWVRYYNDVLLIDLRTGEVVDEIPDFFW